MSLLLLFGSGGGSGLAGAASLVVTASGTLAQGWMVVIDGVQRQIQKDWTIQKSANGRSVMTCEVVSLDGSYRPSLFDEVVLLNSATTVFGGEIVSTREIAAGSADWGAIRTLIQADDFNRIPKRRFVNEDIPSGTLKAALDIVVTYLPGVTLDASQENGPTLPALPYTDVLAEEVLDHLTDMSGGWLWRIDHTKTLRMYAPGTFTAPFNITLANRKAKGDIVVEQSVQRASTKFANKVIVHAGNVRKEANDSASQTARGLWEEVVTAPDDTSETTAQELADAKLAQSLPLLKKVSYITHDDGLETGQTQVITIAQRNINNTFLIDDIRIRPLVSFDPVRLEYAVTATEGLVHQTGWRESYRSMTKSGTVVAGGGMGAMISVRPTYFLGGSGVEAVSSPSPDWVPVAGGPAQGEGSYQVQINTVPRGTTSATITARLRAFDAGVSVQARLYDVTDSVACAGLSPVVTNTDWETVTWTVTLTAGSHLYELQLLPGAANALVYGVASLE